MKKHATDPVSLVFGMIFAAIVGWWVLGEILGNGLPMGWILVGALFAIGIIGLITSVQIGQKKPSAATPFPDEPPVSTVVDDGTDTQHRAD